MSNAISLKWEQNSNSYKENISFSKHRNNLKCPEIYSWQYHEEYYCMDIAKPYSIDNWLYFNQQN